MSGDTRKRRVAMVAACPYPVPQGSQALLRETALNLQERGHEVHLLVYGYGEGEVDGRVPVHRCARVPGAHKTAAGPSPAKPLLDLAMVAALRRLVRRQGIEIVHAHNYEGLLVGLAARVRPLVYHAHNAMADELPYYFKGSGIAARMGAWLDHAAPRRATHVIAPHQALAEYLIACGCAPAQVSVVPPSAPIEAFHGAPQASDAPPVLYTGNLDAYQNLSLLTEVIARVRKTHPDTRLVLATNSASGLPGADVVPVHDFPGLCGVLAEEAIVVVPRVSWSGYPIKLLNAMAAGQAIVACRGAAHPLTHEENALIVPDDDPGAFADAVNRLLADADLRRTLGHAARQCAETHHAPGAIAAAIEALYRRVGN